MAVLFISVLALMTSLTLLVTGLGHIRSPQALHTQLQAQGLSTSAAAVVATVTTAAEVAMGIGGLWSIFSSGTALPFIGATGLLTSYAVWLQALRMRRPGAPCGCSRIAAPVDGKTVLRAAVLAAAAATTALALGSSQQALTVHQTVTAILAACTSAVLVWNMPGALRQFTPVSGRR